MEQKEVNGFLECFLKEEYMKLNKEDKIKVFGFITKHADINGNLYYDDLKSLLDWTTQKLQNKQEIRK